MPKHVKFDSTVNCPPITLLVVTINGEEISRGGTVVTKYEKDVSTGTLIVEYDIAAPNGSGYTITYTCTSDGVAKSDPAKASPVTGKVTEFNGKIEILNIPL
ncbi:hypothetical protein ACCC92_03185 [Mucilaginibacter sp. Mucisp84]|uniref:hypothetical protein n=1 Tax=Mucilaginibacter sp. Mucisp84 TaxID=3243058 RepID=UPI0039A505A3